ncbi:MAG: hypothetical protein V5B44_10480 [Candidatus Accumulibacter necessarius]|uniref:hypothetical protein n=1 Tax=Candidatus Accumulibacter necessarius TaxID=2954386 RepID=UPI002FC2B2C9
MPARQGGTARFYAEWEPLAARLRKLLAESVADVTEAIVEAGAVDAPRSRAINDEAVHAGADTDELAAAADDGF